MSSVRIFPQKFQNKSQKISKIGNHHLSCQLKYLPQTMLNSFPLSPLSHTHTLFLSSHFSSLSSLTLSPLSLTLSFTLSHSHSLSLSLSLSNSLFSSFPFSLSIDRNETLIIFNIKEILIWLMDFDWADWKASLGILFFRCYQMFQWMSESNDASLC